MFTLGIRGKSLLIFHFREIELIKAIWENIVCISGILNHFTSIVLFIFASFTLKINNLFKLITQTYNQNLLYYEKSTSITISNINPGFWQRNQRKCTIKLL